MLTMYLWSGLLAFGTVAIAITRQTIPVLIAMAVLAVIAVVLSRLPGIGQARTARPSPGAQRPPRVST
ncbi:MAG: hypothetical protein H0T99_08885 [Geodermatophilaceae bacterium]|nr:hypothetical protein [Geodermatophilaceae bacterium]